MIHGTLVEGIGNFIVEITYKRNWATQMSQVFRYQTRSRKESKCGSATVFYSHLHTHLQQCPKVGLASGVVHRPVPSHAQNGCG